MDAAGMPQLAAPSCPAWRGGWVSPDLDESRAGGPATRSLPALSSGFTVAAHGTTGKEEKQHTKQATHFTPLLLPTSPTSRLAFRSGSAGRCLGVVWGWGGGPSIAFWLQHLCRRGRSLAEAVGRNWGGAASTRHSVSGSFGHSVSWRGVVGTACPRLGTKCRDPSLRSLAFRTGCGGWIPGASLGRHSVSEVGVGAQCVPAVSGRIVGVSPTHRASYSPFGSRRNGPPPTPSFHLWSKLCHRPG